MEEFKIIQNRENENSKYKKKYLRLFNAITDAIECENLEEAKNKLLYESFEVKEESVYKKMYFVLIQGIKEALDKETKEIFNEVLIQAQQQTEDMYV